MYTLLAYICQALNFVDQHEGGKPKGNRGILARFSSTSQVIMMWHKTQVKSQTEESNAGRGECMDGCRVRQLDFLEFLGSGPVLH